MAGKRDSRRRTTTGFSENVVVMETMYQMLEVLSFCKHQIKTTVLTFMVKKGEMKLSGLSIFWRGGIRVKVFRPRI